MKTKIGSTIVIIALFMALARICSSCENVNEETSNDSISNNEVVEPKGNLPLNLNVFIDLSDRIIKNRDGLRQDVKDLEILNTIAQYVGHKAQSGNIKIARDHMKVLFYPAPVDSDIDKRAKALEVDFGSFTKKDLVAKLQRANDLASDFNKDLQVIYNNAIEQHNFTGSDIWGFFNSKVNNYCVREGFRNVLVILTDGYILDENHMVQDAGSANYITKSSLTKGLSLMPTGQKVDNLEVLVLEVNADPVGDFTRIQSTIAEWLNGMGIKTCKIAETDLPANTKVLIEDFLKK